MSRLFDDPSADERFYARALAILAGPTRRMAILLRLCNLAYWLSVMALLGWLLAQAFDRRPAVVVHSARLLTPNVTPGEVVRVAYEITRQRTCETDLSWAIYDGIGEIHRFGPLHVAAPGLPGREIFVHGWATPSNAASGPGRLRVVLAFACPGNYLQALYPVALVLPDLDLQIGPKP